MKATAIAIAVVCALLGVSLVSGSRAQPQQPGQNFELAMCNMSDFAGVFVAIMHKQDAQKWAVNGWYALPDRGCSFLGTFLRDQFYYFADSIDGASWAGAAADQTASAQCVDRNKLFEGPGNVGTCPTGQTSVRFRLVKVAANLPRLTMSLTGSRSP